MASESARFTDEESSKSTPASSSDSDMDSMSDEEVEYAVSESDEEDLTSDDDDDEEPLTMAVDDEPDEEFRAPSDVADATLTQATDDEKTSTRKRRGGALRSAPRQRRRVENLMPLHEHATLHASGAPPDLIEPYVPETPVAKQNFLKSLTRLSERTFEELMYAYCVYRAQRALRDRGYEDTRRVMESLDSSPDVIDDIVLHACFTERNRDFLHSIIKALGSTHATSEQRALFRLVGKELASAYALAVKKEHVNTLTCRVSNRTPRKVAGRVIEFSSRVVPTLEELMGDTLSDAFTHFYDDCGGMSDDWRHMVYTFKGTLYVDQAYQAHFVSFFVLMRYGAAVSGDALRRMRRECGDLLGDGKPIDIAVARFLERTPNWWAQWAGTYMKAATTMQEYTGVRALTPLRDFILNKRSRMVRP